MKSSAVALYYPQSETSKEYLINLIDSPGHIDFHTEVLSAARLSDGAIIVVDVIEGVCAQTLSSIEIAYREKLKMILVLNKIDRLIIEKRMNATEIHLHLTQVLENVNAVVAEIRLRDYTLKIEDDSEAEQQDDEFRPELRNVVFTSATDGWGFRLYEFAKMYNKQLGKSVDWLEDNLWNDVYYNKKNNEFLTNARQKNKKPLFVTLILENLLTLYDTIIMHRNPDKITKILDKLNIKVNRDTNSSVPKNQLRAVATEWLPVSEALMSSVIDLVPSPRDISQEKIDYILRKDNLNDEQKQIASKIEPYLLSSSCKEFNVDNTPIIAYVSKFITVDKSKLYRKTNIPTQVDIAARRQIIAQMRLDMQKKQIEKVKKQEESRMEAVIIGDSIYFGNNKPEQNGTKQNNTQLEKEKMQRGEEKEKESTVEFIACARIFSGTLKTGTELYILSPNTNFGIADIKSPDTVNKKIKITEMYLLLGRDIVPISEAVAGNIVGIGNISKNLLKSGTLSSTLDSICIIENDIALEPFYRTAITPLRTFDLPNLIEAIKLLLQSDSCMQCVEQEDGQLVLLTAGDVHLEKCKEDLKHFTDIAFDISKPMVRLRETIVIEKEDLQKCVTLKIDEVGLCLSLYATSIPSDIEKIINDNYYILKTIELSEKTEDTPVHRKYKNASEKICKQLNQCFESFPLFKNAADKIIAIGNNQFDTCLLINTTENYNGKTIWKNTNATDIQSFYDQLLISGFQLATQAGLMCGEPLKNVMFCVTNFQMDLEAAKKAHTNTSGTFISEIKDMCHKALENQSQRLMEPFYKTTLNVEASIMGKLSKSLYKRNGRITSTMQFAPGIFTVTAVLPVVDSFNFCNEIRTDTGGKANPFLEFSHYEIIDQNPFDVLILDDEETEIENRAYKLMNDVRKRKGLHVDEKIVMHAEKQRTLNRKK